MKNASLQCQIALSIARAQWWTAYANTPANLAREVRIGVYGNPRFMSHKDLIDDAMNTANVHLTRAQEALDELNMLKHIV